MRKIKYSVKIKLILVLVGSAFSLFPTVQAQTVTNNGDTIFIGNGQTFYVNGSIQNLDNGVNYSYIKNEGVLNLTGNLTKSPNMIYGGNDSVLLSGSSAQSIAGLSYWYLGITGGGNKSLSGNATIKNKIQLSNGYLYTNTDTLTLDSSATIKEDSADYVIGTTTTSKYLQKGIKDTFGGIGLEIKADSMAPGMTIVNRTTGTHLSGNGNQSVNRYFTVTPARNGSTGSTIIFHYFDGELNSIAENDLAIYRREATGKWQYNGYTSRNSGINTITASIDSLGIFTAGSISNPLPVVLIHFDAHLITQESSLLSWSTASEMNNDHFDIERSEDGKIFEKIGEQKGSGTTNDIHYYQYTDNFGISTSNILYYRLKQIDYNGAYEYSEIRKVILDEKIEKLKAWYNSSIEKMEATAYYEKETHASLKMVDIQGKLIAEQNINFARGNNHIQLDMHGLAKGIYTFFIADENGIEVKRVMKY